MLKKSSLLLGVLFLFSVNLLAQEVFNGKITGVIDGRTAIFTTQTGNKITILMDNIEVPDPEQLLSKVVKEHLEKLTLNKDARFVAQSTYSQGFIGKLFIGDIEINQQMLRDGAAWYNLPEKEFAADRKQYQELENLAKSEKLGVWGIVGLKPSWEFRTERYDKEIAAKNLKIKKATEKAMADRASTQAKWAEMPETKQNESENKNDNAESIFDPNGKLTEDYDVFTDKGFVGTPTIILQTTGSRKIFAVQYHFTGNRIKKGGNQFLVAIAGVDYDDEVIFLTGKGERFNLGSGQRTGSKSVVYIYNIDRNSLIKMVNSKKVFVKIGVSEAVLDDAFLNAINRLLWATK